MTDNQTTAPEPARKGCYFCDGSGIVNQTSYDSVVADGLEQIAWKPGTRCMCTFTWAEIEPHVAEICTEIANGR